MSPPQPVERVVMLAGESVELHALIPAVHEAFNKAERQNEGRYSHPVDRRGREGREPDLEAVYAAGDQPRYYYVEATRRYRVLGRPADQCEAVAFGTGWFVRDGDAVRPLELGVDLLRCDRTGASYMLPLGVMRLRGDTYWLAQFSGFDHERYAVIAIKPKTVKAVLSIWGGTCSR